jgi:lipopolysaccharide transport protein LptA
MANFLSRFCICALAFGCSALAAQDGAETSEIVLEMQSLSIDSKTNLVDLRAPVIKQGDMSIVADEALATSTDFEAESEWRLKGHVRITIDSAVITADSAVFTLDAKQLARGELIGRATFEDARTDGKPPVRGGASKVVYDYATRTLRLTENAWIHKDQIEAQGCDLVYNLNDDRFTSGSTGCADLFRIRVLPKQSDNGAANAAPQ